MSTNRLQSLIQVSRALSSLSDYPQLFRLVLDTACESLEAEGGTFYLYNKQAHSLSAVVVTNGPLGMDHVLERFDPANIPGLFSVSLEDGGKRQKTISGSCWQTGSPVVVKCTETERKFDLGNVRRFDAEHGYKTKSIVAVPLMTKDREVLGVLQLVNVDDALLSDDDVTLLEALASVMSMAVENNLLLIGTEDLLTAVVELISSAIDERSKVTGGHCFRVTELTMMLAKAMVADQSGPYKDYTLSEEDLDELRIAALLHDIGKIATPDHVLQKNKKLQAVDDRIGYLGLRFKVRELELRNKQLLQALESKGIEVPEPVPEGESMADDLSFVEKLNTGGEFLSDEAKDRLLDIGGRSCMDGQLIEGQDLENLMIKRGTLNEQERKVMQDHASVSIKLLGKLPWPAWLADVPEIAGKHHENCDGSGYPMGLNGDQMSMRAKILSLTDRFEGISAPDRGYRDRKTLGQVKAIMEDMSSKNQIDTTLYEFFIDSGVCDMYAKRFLGEELEEKVAVRS